MEFKTLPVLPLRGVVLFPHQIAHFDVGRDKSVSAIEESMVENQLLFLLAQKNPELERITPDDLYTVGTIAKIKQILKISENDVRVLVEGISRAKLVKFTSTSPFFECEVEEYVPDNEKTEEELITEDAYVREISKRCALYFGLQGKFERDAMVPISNIKDPEQFSDAVSAALNVNIEIKQQILEEFDIIKRMEKILSVPHSETEILKIEKVLCRKVR